MVLVSRSAFQANGNRAWWWFDGNDACQGFAAQSAAMRLGAPIQTVVWPGATLPTAYLYRHGLLGGVPEQAKTVEDAELLLEESVRFHWEQAATFGLFLLLLVFALGSRWSGSQILGLSAAALLACNQWFLWALFHVRAEVPSIVFMLAACWWADSRRTIAWPILRPTLFGVLIGLAFLSKIQILPVLPLAVWLYVRRDRGEGAARSAPIAVAWPWTAACLVAAASTALMKTKAVDGSGYGLYALPATFTHVCMAAVLASVVGLVLMAKVGRPAASVMAKRTLLVGGGMVVSLMLLVLPVLWLGGVQAAWASANRIVFGSISYARYGLQLESSGGWGLKEGLVERARSFIDFQTSSHTYGWNPSIWTGVILMACAFLATAFAVTRRRGLVEPPPAESGNPSEFRFAVAIVLYLTALLCDLATTHRTVSSTSYAFYHIFSLPFYFLSIASALGCIWVGIRQIGLATFATQSASVVAVVLIGVCSTQLLLSAPRLKQWEAGMKPAFAYFGDPSNSTKVIGGVAPEFWTRTGVSYETLKDHVLRRDAAQRSSSSEPSK